MCSRAGSARRSACAPCACFGHGAGVEVFDPGVMKLADLLDQQEIYAGHSLRLGAESADIHALIPTKYVDGQVIQLLHFWDLSDGRRGTDAFEVEIVIGRILRRLSTWSQAGNRADRSVHRKQWSSLFFTLTIAFLDLTAVESGM